jgi:DNA polymerase elongation subunit (family B)
LSEFYTNVSQIGNHILIRGFDEKGERVQRKVLYEPYLFISTNKKTAYHDITGRPVERKNFENISEARDFVKQYSDVGGIQIYGYDRWPYVYIYDHYKDINPDTTKVNIVGLDIEVASDDGFPEPESANKEVTAITIRRGDMKIILGCGEFKSNDKNIYYIQCKNEVDLLEKFLLSWENLDVDVVTGWNTEFFDIPYLVHRISKLLSEESSKRLSPWNRIRQYTVNMGVKTSIGYEITGIASLDYLAVYRKFQLAPRDSYRLDNIVEIELGEKKLDYSEHGNLHNLYREDYQKFIEYNIRDVDLIFMLEERLGYINQIFALAYDSGTNFNDGLSTLTNWDTIIHNYLMDSHTVVPHEKPRQVDHTIEGGYVKPPIVGMHKWVMSFDLNSLYPHLIMQYNISPDTRIESIPELDNLSRRASVDSLLNQELDTSLLENYDVTMTPNGKFYSKKNRGFLSELMMRMYEGRKKYKSRMIEAKIEYQTNPSRDLSIEISRCDNMQHALKILLNSAYGAIANKYFRWFELDNASAITISGQLSIRWIEKRINEYMNHLMKTEGVDYVLAVDTDSVYVCFDRLVSAVFDDDSDRGKIIDFLDKVAETKVQPFIDDSYRELKEYLNAYEQKMIMKRENIADKAIWTAKKRYIMNVLDSEGVRYTEPQLKMMGIEAIRSSTPGVCRDYIKETLRIIMSEDELAVQKYIAKIREEFFQLPFEEIAFPRGLNFTAKKTNSRGGTYTETYEDSKTIYRKATPIQVKGALLYNHYLKKMGLDKKYESIKDGEKIKFCYLKVPNPIHEKVISCPSDLPVELGLHKYIDYEMQFVKGYLDPINVILNVLDWSHEKKNTLEDFFNE